MAKLLEIKCCNKKTKQNKKKKVKCVVSIELLETERY